MTTGIDKEIHLADVLLLHQAQGLTDGIRAFADQLRQAGHTVHTPDLYDGRTCSDTPRPSRQTDG